MLKEFVQPKVRWEKLRFCRGIMEGGMAIVDDGNGGVRTHHSMVETIPLLTSLMQRLRRREGGRQEHSDTICTCTPFRSKQGRDPLDIQAMLLGLLSLFCIDLACGLFLREV